MGMGRAKRLVLAGVAGVGLIAGAAAVLGSGTASAATLTVTSLSGDAAVVGSLPNRVQAAMPGDEIVFQTGLTGTITLNDALIINKNLTITGPGATDIEIARATAGNIISVSSGDSLDISDLELFDSTGGSAAVRLNSAAASSFTDMVFTDNAVGLVANNSAGVTITDSTFSGTVGRAIDIEDTATVTIGGTTGTVIDNGGTAAQSGNGILLDNVANATVTNTTISGVDIGIDVVGDNNSATAEAVTVTGSMISDTTSGIRVAATHGPVSVTNTSVIDTVSGGNGFGIGISATSGAIDAVGAVTLDTVTVTGSANSAIRFAGLASVSATDLTVTDNPGGGATFRIVSGNATVTGGDYDDNGSDGLVLEDVTGSTSLSDVVAAGNDGEGITVSSSGDVSVTASSSTTGNAEDGLDLQNVGDVTVTALTSTGNGRGLAIDGAGDVTVTGTFDSNIVGSGASNGTGINIRGTVGDISIGATTSVQNNASNGIIVSRSASAPYAATTAITGSTVSGNARTGMQLGDASPAANKTTGAWSVTSSTVSSNDTAVSFGRGIRVDGLGGPITLDLLTVTANPIGLDLNLSSGATLTNSTFSSHTGLAFDFDVPGSVSMTDIVIVNDGGPARTGTGAEITGATSATIDDVTMSQQLSGFRISGDTDDQTAESASISNSTFSDNGSGLSVSGMDGPVTIATTTATSNSGPGISVTGAAAVTLTTVTTTSNTGTGVSVSDADSLTGTGITTSQNNTGVFLSDISGNASLTTGTIDQNNGNGITINGVTGTASFTGFTVTDQSFRGIRSFGTNGGVSIIDSTVTGNTPGIDLNQPGAVVIDDSTVSSNTGGGLITEAAASVTITDSDFDSNTAATGNNDGAGIAMNATTSAVSITDSSIRNNAGEGIEINRVVAAAATTSVSILGDTNDTLITGNGGEGVEFTQLVGPLTIDGATIENNPVGILGDDSDDVTINDVEIRDHTGRAIDISDSGDVALTSIVVDEGAAATPAGLGVHLDGNAAAAITTSSVTSQASAGVFIRHDAAAITAEPVTITSLTSSDNTGDGVEIIDVVGTVSLTGTNVMSSNGADGLSIDDVESVSVAGLTAGANTDAGLRIGDSGSASVATTTASTNGAQGLRVASTGDVSVSQSTFDGNGTGGAADGIELLNLTGSTTIAEVSAMTNSDEGISVEVTGNGSQRAAATMAMGDISITGPTNTSNNVAGAGISVDLFRNGGTGFDGPDVTVTGTTSTGNARQGITVRDPGAITIGTSTFDGNTLDGGGLFGAEGAVSITSTSFDDNDDSGLASLNPLATGTVLDSVSADDNGERGASISSAGTVVVRNGSSMSGNGNQVTPGIFDDGLRVSGATSLTISDSTLDGNADDGFEAGFSSSLIFDATESTFDGNGRNGLDLQDFVSIAIEGGSASGNGEFGAFLGSPSSSHGSVSIDDLDVFDNPDGVRINQTTSVAIADSRFGGHTNWPIFISTSGAVTIDGVDVNNGSATVDQGNGVLVGTVASVDVDDLDVSDQDADGAEIRVVTGDVSVDGSSFSSNNGQGLQLDDIDGAVSVATTTASDNTGNGVTASRNGPVSLTTVTASNNAADGVGLSFSGVVTVVSLTADDNGGDGFDVNNVTGSVEVDTASTRRNAQAGVRVATLSGAATLAKVTATGNALEGVRIGNTGNVSVSGSAIDTSGATGLNISNVGTVNVAGTTVTNSDGDGFSVLTSSSITITGSTFDGSKGTTAAFGVGAELEFITGSVTVTDSRFRSNATTGLDIRDATAGVSISGSTAALNTRDGVRVGGFGAPSVGDLVIRTSTFDDNGEIGVSIGEAANVTLDGVVARRNFLPGGVGGAGPSLASNGTGVTAILVGDLSVIAPTITDNGGAGLRVDAAGDVSIVGGDLSDNTGNGAFVLESGTVEVSNVSIEDNGETGALFDDGTSVDIEGVVVRGNASNGLSVGAMTGRVDVADSVFADHPQTGLSVNSSAGPVDVADSDFLANRVGANLANVAASSRFDTTTFTPGGANTTGIQSNDLGGLVVVDSSFTELSNSITSRDITGDVAIESSTFERSANNSLEFVDMVGDVFLVESSVIDNRVGLILRNVVGSATIDRSTFADSGGADALVENPFDIVSVTNVTGGLDVVNSSFFDNENTYVIDAVGTQMTVRHSTLAENDDRSPIRTDVDVSLDHSIVLPAFDPDNSFPARSVELVAPAAGDLPVAIAQFSLVSSGPSLGATNLVELDPQLAPAADNGGDTETRAPRAASPAVEAGDPAITGAPATDQTGAARVEGVIEIGAVEFDPDLPQPPPPASLIESLAPERFADTRPSGETLDSDFEADGRLAPQGEYRVAIAGRGAVPADAEGVVMNITAVGVDGNGFVTAHPCVTPRPLASSLNYTGGVNLGNEIVAGLSDSGEICLFSSRGTHLTVDVTGYVPAGSAVVSITPTRFMDTRPGESTFDNIGDTDGKLEGGSNTILLMQSRGDIPSGINGEEGVAAVIVNVTAIGAEGTGFVTVHPCLEEPPLASSLNYVAGVNRGNELIAPVDPFGRICLFTSATTHLTVDVVGYVPLDTDLDAVDPSRLLDTRPGQVTVDGEAAGAGKVAGGGSITLQVGGRGDVPDDAKAVVVNVTAIAPETVGFVTVHPCLDPAPNASSLNYVPGVNGGNEIIALLDDDGQICLFTSSTAHLAVDVVAYLE